MENIFFPIFWHTVKFEVMDYLIHYLKFEKLTALYYVNYLSDFQKWNLNKDINFPILSIDSKLGFFGCWT